MGFTIKFYVLSGIFALTSGDYYYHTQEKFRPSPIDHYADKWNQNRNTINNYNYNSIYKKPTFQPAPGIQQGHEVYGVPDNFPKKPLFVPANVPYPAESSGQIENYNRAVLEELEEAQKANAGQGFYDTGLGNIGQSYVNVKLGGDQNIEYQYSV